MKKFRINELTASNDSNTSGHHGMRSPSSLSLASSSTSINHQAPPERLTNVANNNMSNMSHSSIPEPARANQFYQSESNLTLPQSGNINWRDEADGSEEEECRLNVAAHPAADLQPANLQTNLYGQHSSNLLSHQAPVFSGMIEHDLRCQPLNNNNSADSSRASTNKNLESNFKEKQLRDTELYIDRIEDLLVSFKNLLKSGEANQASYGLQENININSNVCSNNLKTSQTVPKMTNNSNSIGISQPTYLRVSNQLVHNANNFTMPKNTHPNNELAEDISRNDKNRKFSNNRHLLQNDFPPQLNNNNYTNMVESDFINDIPFNEDHLIPEGRVDQFYRLINIQINSLRKRLEQLALATDMKESHHATSNLFNDGYNDSNQRPFNEMPQCDIDNCCVPSDLHLNDSDDHLELYLRTLNQQIYQLLMFQNYQINQQHELIQSWINSQQKWLEKQSRSPFKFANNSRDAQSNAVNNLYFNDIAPVNNYHHHLNNNKTGFVYPPDMTLNNQTEPRSRANNFWDNFRSHSHQNKLQSSRNLAFNRDPYSTSHHGNCSNSCINIGPCNKNSRSQSFAGFGNNNSQKCQPNNFTGNMHSGPSNYGSAGLPSSLPFGMEKKLNTNMDPNIQQLNNLLCMVGKIVETDPTPNAFNANSQRPNSKVNYSSSLINVPAFNSPFMDSKSSCKRKKISNKNNGDVGGLFEQALQESVPEFENEDDHDSIDMEEPSPFDQALRSTANNTNELSNMLSCPSTSTGPNASSTLPTCLNFHMDKCNFQLPLTISPHTGAIRKKPLYDCNFKFAATDNQKLSMQHHSQLDNKSDNSHANSFNLDVSSNENIRPLMPAEGRSSEQLLSNAATTLMNASKPKLPNSSQKYSTRPPITGAGNEFPASKPSTSGSYHSSEDSLNNGIDDDIKWNKLSGSDMQSNGSLDKMSPSDKDRESSEQKEIPFNGNDALEDLLDSGVELAATEMRQSDGRMLNGSVDHAAADGKKEIVTKSESSFIVPVSSVVHSGACTSSACLTSSISPPTSNNMAMNKSVSSGEIVEAQPNGGENVINALNGRFLPEVDVVRVNGHNGHMIDHHDDDLDDDKDTDVRLLSLAGNAVEVRSTVRLSGDGEQGL